MELFPQALLGPGNFPSILASSVLKLSFAIAAGTTAPRTLSSSIIGSRKLSFTHCNLSISGLIGMVRYENFQTQDFTLVWNLNYWLGLLPFTRTALTSILPQTILWSTWSLEVYPKIGSLSEVLGSYKQMTINQKPREHSYTYIFWKNIQWDFYKTFEVLRPLSSWTLHFIKIGNQPVLSTTSISMLHTSLDKVGKLPILKCCDYQYHWPPHHPKHLGVCRGATPHEDGVCLGATLLQD